MAYGDIGAVIDTLEFDTGQGTYSQILRVAGDIYAIAYADANGDGRITTVSVDAAGEIGNTVIATELFEAGSADWIGFVHVSGNVFAVIGRNSFAISTVYTVDISDDGATIANISSLAFEETAIMHQDICHVTGNIYAIGFSDTGATFCKIVTLTISDAGAISGNIDTLTIDSTNGYYVKIVKVSDSVVAVVYNTTSYVITVATVGIDSAGNIGGSALDTVAIDTADTWAPCCIAKALDDAYIVAYQGPGGDGWAKSITITSAGEICASPIDSIEFDAADCTEPDALGIGLGLVAIVYKGFNADGYICTIEADSAGNITDAVKDSLEFDIINCVTPAISHVTGDIYAIAYGGDDNDGYVKSLDISTPPAGNRLRHLMMGLI